MGTTYIKTLHYLVMLAMLCGFNTISAQNPGHSTDAEQALFLYNLTQFVEWPDSAFVSPDSSLVIGIPASSAIAEHLDQLIMQQQPAGRPLRVKRYQSSAGALDSHILFLAQDSTTHIAAVDKAKNAHVLTVSAAENFTERGGMIQLYFDQQKLRVKINLQSTKDCSFILSSKLLRVVEVCCNYHEN